MMRIISLDLVGALLYLQGLFFIPVTFLINIIVSSRVRVTRYISNPCISSRIPTSCFIDGYLK